MEYKEMPSNKPSYLELKSEIITPDMKVRLEEILAYIKCKVRQLAPVVGLDADIILIFDHLVDFAGDYTDRRYLLHGFARLSDGSVRKPLMNTGRYLDEYSANCFPTEKRLSMQKIHHLWNVLFLLYYEEDTVSMFLEENKDLERLVEKGIDEWDRILNGRKKLKYNLSRQLKKLRVKMIKFYRWVIPAKIEITITRK